MEPFERIGTLCDKCRQVVCICKSNEESLENAVRSMDKNKKSKMRKNKDLELFYIALVSDKFEIQSFILSDEDYKTYMAVNGLTECLWQDVANSIVDATFRVPYAENDMIISKEQLLLLNLTLSDFIKSMKSSDSGKIIDN